MDEHLDRLFEAAKAIDLDIGMDRAALVKALTDTQEANGMETDVTFKDQTSMKGTIAFLEQNGIHTLTSEQVIIALENG